MSEQDEYKIMEMKIAGVCSKMLAAKLGHNELDPQTIVKVATGIIRANSKSWLEEELKNFDSAVWIADNFGYVIECRYTVCRNSNEYVFLKKLKAIEILLEGDYVYWKEKAKKSMENVD